MSERIVQLEECSFGFSNIISGCFFVSPKGDVGRGANSYPVTDLISESQYCINIISLEKISSQSIFLFFLFFSGLPSLSSNYDFHFVYFCLYNPSGQIDSNGCFCFFNPMVRVLSTFTVSEFILPLILLASP